MHFVIFADAFFMTSGFYGTSLSLNKAQIEFSTISLWCSKKTVNMLTNLHKNLKYVKAKTIYLWPVGVQVLVTSIYGGTFACKQCNKCCWLRPLASLKWIPALVQSLAQNQPTSQITWYSNRNYYDDYIVETKKAVTIQFKLWRPFN